MQCLAANVGASRNLRDIILGGIFLFYWPSRVYPTHPLCSSSRELPPMGVGSAIMCYVMCSYTNTNSSSEGLAPCLLHSKQSHTPSYAFLWVEDRIQILFPRTVRGHKLAKSAVPLIELDIWALEIWALLVCLERNTMGEVVLANCRTRVLENRQATDIKGKIEQKWRQMEVLFHHQYLNIL